MKWWTDQLSLAERCLGRSKEILLIYFLELSVAQLRKLGMCSERLWSVSFLISSVRFVADAH